MDGGGIMIYGGNDGGDLGTSSYYGQGLPESMKAGYTFFQQME